MSRLALSVVSIALVLLLQEVNVSAQDKEVPYPKLPTGAGKIDKDAAKTFTTTPSGLGYRVLRAGTGDKPTAANRVSVNYQGWVASGKVFDSSYKRGEPTAFPLKGVIKGWTEGLQLVGEGGMIELAIPASLAYGDSPPPGSGIGAGDTLYFLVELLEVK